jgi:hypothetical protein
VVPLKHHLLYLVQALWRFRNLEVPMSKAVLAFAISWVLGAGGAVYAQSKPADPQTTHPSEGVEQPQGKTGPITTKSGGAPPSSPQGDTPAGMQPVQKGPTSKDQSNKGKRERRF